MTASKSDRRKARNAMVKHIRREMPHVSDPKALARKMVQQAVTNLKDAR
jgi:hypothetical protein